MPRFGFLSFCVLISVCVLFLFINQQTTDSLQQNFVPDPHHEVNAISEGSEFYHNNFTSMETVLTESKWFIQSQMQDYKYLDGESLEKLTPRTNGTPRRNLIITTWRSGSTFLGEILNSIPGTLYHYEPFSDYDIVQIRGAPEAGKAVEHLKKLLHCNYTNMENFLEFSRNNVWVFYHNERLWEQCQRYPQYCFEPEFLSQFCKLMPFQMMKVVRLRLSLTEELLKE